MLISILRWLPASGTVSPSRGWGRPRRAAAPVTCHVSRSSWAHHDNSAHGEVVVRWDDEDDNDKIHDHDNVDKMMMITTRWPVRRELEDQSSNELRQTSPQSLAFDAWDTFACLDHDNQSTIMMIVDISPVSWKIWLENDYAKYIDVFHF